MSVELDPQEELANAPVGRLHVLLGAMMALVTLFDGYDTFNPAYVIHYVARPWGLTPAQSGLLVSSGLVGFLFGALGHGLVADRYGRRGTLLGGLWLVNAFTVLTPVFGDGFASFCLLRIFTGIGLGILMPLASTYINELAPRRVSNAFSLLGVGLGWSLGGTLAGVVGVFLTPAFGWQVLYVLGALSVPFAALLHLVLPESPQFLVRQGRTDELRRLLARLSPDRTEAIAGARFRMPPAPPRGRPVAALLAPQYRRLSLTIWTTSFLGLFCIFGLTGWIPTVMMARGESFAASFGFGALMQATCFFGGLLLAVLIDRRPSASTALLGSWWASGGLAVLTLAVTGGHVLNVACVAAAGFLTIGALFVLNNFTAGAYDTSMRATAVGMELGVGRVGAILGPFVAGLLQQVTGGPAAMFCAIGLASLLAGATIASLGRRTSRSTGTQEVAALEPTLKQIGLATPPGVRDAT